MRRLAILALMACLSGTLTAQEKISGVVTFAGGRVEAQLPAGWSALEMPTGRRYRLVLSQIDKPQRFVRLPQGFWIAAHSDSGAAAEHELVARYLPLAFPAAKAEPARRTSLGEADAATARFTLDDRVGQIVVCRFDWGTLEVGCLSAASSEASFRQKFEGWLGKLKFKNRPLTATKPEAGLEAMEPLVGTWKSFRSVIEFQPNGQLRLSSDQLRVLHHPSPEFPRLRPEIELRGKVQARGDLLFVVWEDQSKLNIRWKVVGPHLLLTDHRGKTSRLQRVVK